MENTNLIYGLRDPRNDVYYYIGKTTIGENRPMSHLSYSHNVNVRLWVDSLNKLGIEPFIDIIERDIELSELSIKEKMYINTYKQINNNILNIQSIDNDAIETNNIINDESINTLKNALSDIPKLIKSIRFKYRLTQQELSDLCNINRSTLSCAENSNSGNVKISLIQQIINKTENMSYEKSKNKRKVRHTKSKKTI